MRKGKVLGTAGALVLVAAAVAAAGTPALRAPTMVLDGKEPIDVDSGHATPNVADWDGDGKMDLLVGQFGGGRLRVYLNRGTSAEPSFKGCSFVQAGGTDATVPVN